MKEIQEIITNMENISKEQVATDLSKEEKEELINLINVSNFTPLQNDSSVPFCTPTPTPTPIPTCSPDNACTPQPFCCAVAFSNDLNVDPNEIHAAVVPKNVSIESDGQCTTRIGNCTITLIKGTINGCAEVFVSLGVKDRCGNCSFVCCTDFICLFQQDIICCVLPTDPNKIKFIVNDLMATRIATACDESQQVWQISGTITFTCDECM
ncbi:hypothetical protein [Clostridium sp. OS1-26]|uniref:hypothetical protein n=1 Tax=Clostridium sp. OS1-26 TaxID=3070681 RepID=UPI0027DF29FB|nr:hypothetical protein [Clostridium sp. OS1-26]WML35831.1 hypothetical protein RCG18_03525 [Clostridium sp. OS1-26]